MEKILNITNGDSAVALMQDADIPGRYLPWRDVLHDGPVPEGLSLEELSKVRADFIAACGWGESEKIKQEFIARDRVLKDFAQYQKIILWFEHDLYDQLQILQILDWFYGHYSCQAYPAMELTMICTDQYLGMQKPESLKALMQYETPITASHLDLAHYAWSAFCASTPEPWFGLLSRDTHLFPFLNAAVLRQLEEYPSCKNGLSRTEQQALHAIANGESDPVKTFIQNQEQEQAIYLGDSSFWRILQGFIEASSPLITLSHDTRLDVSAKQKQSLFITDAGQDVLSGKQNWLQIKPPDRWIGGVHLNIKKHWCWDRQTKQLNLRS